MSDQNDASKVVFAAFGTRPYSELEELRSRISNLIHEYAGTVPVAGVIGVLRIVEHELIKSQS